MSIFDTVMGQNRGALNSYIIYCHDFDHTMTGMPITTAARLLAEWVFTVFAASYFVVWGLVLSLVCLCVRPFLSQRQAHRIARFSMHYLLRSYFAALGLSGLFKVDCSALESLRNERGMIIIANHPCLMDALFVNSRLPNAVSVIEIMTVYYVTIQRTPILTPLWGKIGVR